VRPTGGALLKQGPSKMRIGPPSGGPILFQLLPLTTQHDIRLSFYLAKREAR